MTRPPQAPVTVLYAAWAPFFSGAERALVVLLDGLDRARFRPVVAVGTHGELETELKRRRITTLCVPVTYVGARTLVPWGRHLARLAGFARRERAALVHANDVPSFQPAGYVARLLRIPAVAHVRFPDSADGFAWFLKPGFERALFVSAALRDDAIRVAPDLFEHRSEVVHDGVVAPDVVSDAARLLLRAELSLPADRTVVALTGQISEIKGIWEFIDAVEILVARQAPAFFAILGDDLKGKGALRREVEARVRERGLAEHVRFLGFRPNAPRLIPAFDVVAVPSHVEPLGLAALEAMAAGRPVVGSRVGGIPEIVVDGETGLLVPPRSAATLAEAVETLVRHPDRARAFGLAGHRRARASFSVEAHVRQVQHVYDRLLSNPEP